MALNEFYSEYQAIGVMMLGSHPHNFINLISILLNYSIRKRRKGLSNKVKLICKSVDKNHIQFYHDSLHFV